MTLDYIIELCEKYNCSPDTIVVLFCIINSKKISHIIKDFDKLEIELNSFGFILNRAESGIQVTLSENHNKEIIDDLKGKVIPIVSKVENTSKFIMTGSIFNEVFNLYPQKVLNTNGTIRILRPIGEDTLQYDVLYKKYSSKIKSLEQHQQVVKAINYLLTSTDHRFLQNFATFINQNSWENYINLEPESDPAKSIYK